MSSLPPTITALSVLFVFPYSACALADDSQKLADQVTRCFDLGKRTELTAELMAELAGHLQSDVGQLRWAAAWALGQRGESAISKIAAIAKAGTSQQRRAAALTLSQLVARDSSALVPLCGLLKSGDPIERYYVLRGLERVSLSDSSLRRNLLLLPASCEVWTAKGGPHHRLPNRFGTNTVPGINLRSWHELKLLELGPPDTDELPMLRRLLDHRHPVVRRLAVSQIGMFRNRVGDASDAIRPLVSDTNDEVCLEALQTLRKLNRISSRDQATLSELLDASSILKPTPMLFGFPLAAPATRSRAIGLEALAALAELNAKDIVGDLITAIGDRRPAGEETAISSALARLSDAPPEELISMLNSSRAELRRRACNAVGEFEGRGGCAVPALISLLQRDLHASEQTTLAIRRAAWKALGRIGPAAKEALPALQATLESVKERVWRDELHAVIACCSSETRGKSHINEGGRPQRHATAREQRRTLTAQLLMTLNNEDSLSGKPRYLALRIVEARNQASRELTSLGAIIISEFIDDMKGGAPSREAAIERLAANFNNLEEARMITARLCSNYRYHRFRPYARLAGKALGLDSTGVAEDRLKPFSDDVLAVLRREADPKAIRSLAAYGPAAVPFIAAHIGDSERRLHFSACLALKSMGYWAAESVPILKTATRGEDAAIALRALECVSPSDYADVMNSGQAKSP